MTESLSQLIDHDGGGQAWIMPSMAITPGWVTDVFIGLSKQTTSLVIPQVRGSTQNSGGRPYSLSGSCGMVVGVTPTPPPCSTAIRHSVIDGGSSVVKDQTGPHTVPDGFAPHTFQ